ncbi:MAG: hypothetical protein ABR58_03110 [Acidimicrobium sp. BACL19 MAG-120924-bin39]|nr:MAG: hypothetical protein ABR58_03110 [Acidimicrobium sp. BACL19 MAG-120924-bin39]
MKVLERMAGHASGPYHVPTIDVEAIAVRTNNPVGGAFRGFGANQAQFAMEGMLDRLAEQVGISGWEIRRRNVIRPAWSGALDKSWTMAAMVPWPVWMPSSRITTRRVPLASQSGWAWV